MKTKAIKYRSNGVLPIATGRQFQHSITPSLHSNSHFGPERRSVTRSASDRSANLRPIQAFFPGAVLRVTDPRSKMGIADHPPDSVYR